MSDEINDLLAQISVEMGQPKPSRKKLARLNAELDRLIGTELKEEDQDQAEAWERDRLG